MSDTLDRLSSAMVTALREVGLSDDAIARGFDLQPELCQHDNPVSDDCYDCIVETGIDCDFHSCDELAVDWDSLDALPVRFFCEYHRAWAGDQ